MTDPLDHTLEIEGYRLTITSVWYGYHVDQGDTAFLEFVKLTVEYPSWITR